MNSKNQYDVCIIGAGVAGGVLAAYLGQHNIRVAVVEKSLKEQDRIIGELLQPGGVIKLREMGLEHLLEGFDAQPVEGYALFLDGKNFRVSYPPNENGRGFRNGKFVQKIREHIKSLPSVTVIEGTVTHVMEEGNIITGISYTDAATKEEKTIHAALTVVCDGMFSIFRERLSANVKKVSSYFLGLILKDANMPYKNHGHVIVAKPSPCLAYPVTSTETRVLIDFPDKEPPKKSPELVAFLRDQMGPQMPKELQPSFYAAVEEGKFKVMPNHLIPATPKLTQGAVLIGDSLNMRHPLTGGGMTAAFTDILSLGNKLIALKKFDKPSEVTETVRSFYATRHQQNATINILADALYGVMSNEDLKKACYDYLSRGGSYSGEPISILAAVSRDQKLLTRHFFAVAMFGAGNILKPFPTPKKVVRSFNMIRSAVRIIRPLAENERPSRMMRTALNFSKFLF
ncbi:MAG: FAD-dependent monooxygenase [Bacteroidetes bacterium]|nr:FAD-dependent monooxygenase [Bacteroidota bacterium]